MFIESLWEDVETIGVFLPKIAGASLIAALVPLLLPHSLVSRFLGEASGFKGIALASALGSVTPGGPIASFPLVAALRAAGTGNGELIAFLSAWSLIGVQRILMWEIPFMGGRFVLLRLAVSLPLPFIAAAIAMLLAPSILPRVEARDADPE